MSVGMGVEKQWARVRGRLRQEVGDGFYNAWLKHLTFVSIDDGVITVSVPSRFIRDWVDTHYADRLRALWAVEAPSIADVEIVVNEAANDCRLGPAAVMNGGDDIDDAPDDAAPEDDTAAADAANPRAGGPRVNGAGGAEATPADGSGRDGDVGAPLDSRFTFDNFVVGKPNEFAYAAARRVAETDAVPFNPLFLYSGVGLGKTHLMNAIAWHIRQHRPDRKVIYISAETFMHQFIRSLRYRDMVAFKEMFRSVDVLMIDDVQYIGSKDATQEEFFHTFNALVDMNRQVVVSADKQPSDLEGFAGRLKSRLGWGLVADIGSTTYELRLGILQSKVEQRRVDVPPKVLELLAHRIKSNVRELEGAMNRLLAYAQFLGKPVTLDLANDVLRDMLRSSDRRVITIDKIQQTVATHFKIRLAEMSSGRRARSVARPRQVAMYLSKQLTSRSLPEIGRKFGGRDHTTVMHACRKVEELSEQDTGFREDVELLRRTLELDATAG